jgi:hypothetical protein
MSEIVVKLEVPAQMEPEFRSALKKVVERFASEVEYEAALGVLQKSKLTPNQADKLARETKKGIARRHVA